MFFFGRPRLFFFGLDVAGFDACTAVFRGLPLFFFGAEVEGSEAAIGTFAFAGLPLFFFGLFSDNCFSCADGTCCTGGGGGGSDDEANSDPGGA